MKKIIITIIVSIITIIFLISFIDKTPKEKKENTADITYSISNISSNLKSVGELNKREQDIICAISRGLVELDYSGNIVPVLAENIEINNDGLEYVFKIRDDIYWSDGNKITPDDIVAFFRQVVTEDKEIGALLNVFGVKDYIEGKQSFSETVAITATENTVKIRLNSKDSNFLQELTKPQYRVRKDILYWEDIQENFNKFPYSGDYYIYNINDNEVILKRSVKSSIELAETIHLIKDNSEDLALASFEIGNRDIVLNPPSNQLERLNSEGKLISIPSNEAMYLAFNVNNDNFSNDIKNQIYKLINEAIQEYENDNSILVSLAECSYFRQDIDDLNKLQARNVIVNVSKEIENPKKIVLVAEENVKNKELTNFLINWFNKNTDIILVVNLLSKEEVSLISEKNYYDIALIDVYAKLDDDGQLFKTISSFVPISFRKMIENSQTEREKEELFAEIEEELFNNYRVLPLFFYNDTIAVRGNVDSNILDGNGNIDFRSVKNNK